MNRACGDCLATLPTSDFPFFTREMSYGPRCYACERLRSRARYRAKVASGWGEHEMAALRLHYPLGGTAGCKPYIPRRSGCAVRTMARECGLAYVGPRVCGSKVNEAEWAVPAHDYTAPDIALRAWRYPVAPAALTARIAA